MKELISTFFKIGDKVTDSEEENLKHRFLIYLGSFMSLGGLVWGGMCLYFEAYIPALIPLGYSMITPFNFYYFYKSKDFRTARFIQTLMSLLLPFLFQWSLGGFLDSGSMMFWSILSVIGCLGYYETKSSRLWIVLFMFLTALSYLIDPYLELFSMDPSETVQTLFAAINLLIIPLGIYMMVVLFISIRDNANEKLEKQHIELQRSQSQLVQSEKLAALGQLVAGVAHEVNTPLGAIQASVGTITNCINHVIEDFPSVLDGLPIEKRNLLFELLDEARFKKTSVFSSKEERQKKRLLTNALDDLSLEHSDEIADTLIDMGIFELNQKYLPIFSEPQWREQLNFIYNLSEQFKNSRNIQTAVERASKIVFSLKNYSRFDSASNKIEASLDSGIETVLTLYQNQIKKGIEIVKDYKKIPKILCFEDELNQVWTNLIHNSIQALGTEGKITISINADDQNAIVEIVDNGPGIPTEIQDEIFKPFFTTKPIGEGSGLGLDIVKTIIDKHRVI